jgi:hypothetical protein
MPDDPLPAMPQARDADDLFGTHTVTNGAGNGGCELDPSRVMTRQEFAEALTGFREHVGLTVRDVAQGLGCQSGAVLISSG